MPGFAATNPALVYAATKELVPVVEIVTATHWVDAVELVKV